MNRINIYFLFFSISLILFISCRNNSSELESEVDIDNHPAWFKQYVELKGGEEAKIPSGLAIRWYKADINYLHPKQNLCR